MPSDELARLKKLTKQLETAKKAAATTAKEVTRAQATADKVKKDVRLLDTAGRAKRYREKTVEVRESSTSYEAAGQCELARGKLVKFV